MMGMIVQMIFSEVDFAWVIAEAARKEAVVFKEMIWQGRQLLWLVTLDEVCSDVFSLIS
jgi:hypothetical protein